MSILKPVFPALVILCLGACDNDPGVYQDQQQFFNTDIEITLYGVDKTTATQAFATLKEDFEYMHFMWHPWQPGPLGRTNELLALTSEFSANPSVLPLIEQSRKLSQSSNYLYNPALGKLVALWGFHQDSGPTGPPPAADKITSLLAQHPTINDIQLNGIRMRGLNPALQLDFGDLPKALAMEREINTLKNIGIMNACINAGGNIKVSGQRGERPWQFTIPEPRTNDTLATLNMFDGESVFTTKDSDHFYEYQGRRYHRVLDPRTGYPADHTMLVTVIHPNAPTAAAASTALFIAGPKDWPAIADSMNVSYVLLIDKHGHLHMTPAMAERVHLQQSQKIMEINPPLKSKM